MLTDAGKKVKGRKRLTGTVSNFVFGHSQTYKDETLARAKRIGVNRAAKQLGLHASQLYGWRSKNQQT